MQERMLTSNTILYSSVWEATVAFYRTGLGLPVVTSTDWFVEFALTATSYLSVADERCTSIKSGGKAGITIALQVDDLEGVWMKALERGLTPTPIEEHPWNARIFYVFDPEGRRIELWQREVAAEEC